jgi:hypothetical protein
MAGGKFRVSEIWDSRERLEAFAERLMQILAAMGVDVEGEPETFEIQEDGWKILHRHAGPDCDATAD